MTAHQDPPPPMHPVRYSKRSHSRSHQLITRVPYIDGRSLIMDAKNNNNNN